MLSPVPRAEYGLSLPSGAGFNADHMTRWGKPIGSETGRLIVPESFHPQRQFDPINVLISGRRGQMKTATLTAIAKMLQTAYNAQHKNFRVGSNIWLKFAQEAGPLGYDVDTVWNEETGAMEAQPIPVDPCSPRLVDRLLSFPVWAQRMLIAIDELSAVANNRKSLSNFNTDLGVSIEQQRKRDIEFLATTQFPQKIDQNALLLQIDLFVIVQAHSDKRSADLFVFDHWGQFTGKTFRKYWPPHVGEHDWELGISNVDQIWGQYSTKEIVAPSWSKHRDRVISEHWDQDETRGTYEITESARRDEGGEAGPVVVSPVEQDDRELTAALDRLGDDFNVNQARLAGVRFGHRTNVAMATWLEAHGYQVYQGDKGMRAHAGPGPWLPEAESKGKDAGQQKDEETT